MSLELKFTTAWPGKVAALGDHIKTSIEEGKRQRREQREGRELNDRGNLYRRGS